MVAALDLTNQCTLQNNSSQVGVDIDAIVVVVIRRLNVLHSVSLVVAAVAVVAVATVGAVGAVVAGRVQSLGVVRAFLGHLVGEAAAFREDLDAGLNVVLVDGEGDSVCSGSLKVGFAVDNANELDDIDGVDLDGLAEEGGGGGRIIGIGEAALSDNLLVLGALLNNLVTNDGVGWGFEGALHLDLDGVALIDANLLRLNNEGGVDVDGKEGGVGAEVVGLKLACLEGLDTGLKEVDLLAKLVEAGGIVDVGDVGGGAVAVSVRGGVASLEELGLRGGGNGSKSSESEGSHSVLER